MQAKTKSKRKSTVKTIDCLRIANPFDAHSAVRETWLYKPGRTVGSYFPKGTSNSWLVLVNGGVVEPMDFGTHVLTAGDQITISPIPMGGDGAKSVLRIVALIAVAIYAPMLASSMIGIGGAAVLGATGVNMVIAGSIMAGAMLVNALLPVKANKATSNDLSDSPSYGIDGAKNTGAEGIPIPVVYGTFRCAGNVIAQYVENVGDTQVLYMLLNAGEGPVAPIDPLSVLIDDRPAAELGAELILDRLGYPSQPVIPWFANSITPNNLNRLLSEAWTTYTTSGPVDRLRFDFAFQTGLGKTDEKTGAVKKQSVEVLIEAKPYGAPDSQFARVNGYVETGSASKYHYVNYQNVVVGGGDSPDGYSTVRQATSETVSNNLTTGDSVVGSRIIRAGVDVGYVETTATSTATSTVFTDAVRKALRKSVAVENLSGRLDIRVRRTSPNSTDELVLDELYLTDVNEIVTEAVAYNDTALIGIKVTLTDQLNGLPTVTYVHNGRMIPVWDKVNSRFVETKTANAAWVTLDALSHRRYGGGVKASRLDMEAFFRWADFCTLNDLTFNGPFDTQSNIWDALGYITRCGHGQVVPVGTRYTVVVEREDDPAMMFTVANMVKGSFKEDWLPMNDRANEVEVTYFDRLDDYKQKTVRVIDKDAFAKGQPSRSAAITLNGVVDTQKAYDEGYLQLQLNKYVLRTVSFEAPLEAISCFVGSLIYVQHDMPLWGFGGRTEAGSTTTIVKLDRPVTMVSGKTYRILLHYDALQTAVGTVKAIVGGNVFLNGFGASVKADRVIIGGKDLEVVGYATLGNDRGVIVNTVLGLAVGQTYQTFQTDAMVERDVVNTASTVQQVTVTSALQASPGEFRNWMFGEVGKTKKPFRVKSVSGSAAEMTRSIGAVEYNVEVYTKGNTVPPLNYSALESIQHVTIDGVTEDVISATMANTSQVTVKFSGKGLYAGATGWVSRNGKPWELLGTAPDRFTIAGTEGEELVFRILSYDALGATPPLSTAPTITYVVGGFRPQADTVAALVVTGFNATAIPMGAVLNWNTPPTSAGVAGVEIWRAEASTNIANAKLIDTTQSNTYQDIIGKVDVTYTWWARFFSIGVNPAYGPFTEGKSAKTASLLAADTDPADLRPPPIVQNLRATPGLASVVVQWDVATYVMGHGPGKTLIYAASSVPTATTLPTFADAMLMSSPGHPVTITDFSSAIGVRWHIWAKFESKDGVMSTTPAGGEHGITVQTGKIGQVDLVDLLIEAKNLADGAIPVSKFDLQLGGMNQLVNSSMEADINSDGIADGWYLYQWNPNLPPSNYRGQIVDGRRPSTKAQRVLWDNDLRTQGGNVGLQGFIPEGWLPGQWYAVSWYVRSSDANIGMTMGMSWNTAPDTLTPVKNDPYVGGGVWQRYVFLIHWTGVAEGGGRVYICSHDRKTGYIDFDDCQVEQGNLVSGWAPRAQELLPGSIGPTEIQTGGITTEKLAAGMVTTAKLAAGAVTAEKVTIAAKSLNLDASYAAGLSMWAGFNYRSLSNIPGNIPGGCPSTYAACFNGRDLPCLVTQDVIPGEVYRIVGYMHGGFANASNHIASIANGGALIAHIIYWIVDAAGSAYAQVIGAQPCDGNWHRSDSRVTVPSNAIGMRVGGWMGQPHGGPLQGFYADLNWEKAVDALLVVDGTVQAQHLAANSIAVGTAAIQTGAIVNYMLGSGSIDTAKIADAAISRAKIGIGQIDEARIADATIGIGKIQRVLSSDNWNGVYDGNGTGWAIDRNGNMFINSLNARGNIRATSLEAATGTFTGKLTAAVIGLNAGGNATTFEDSAAPGIPLLSSAAGYLTIGFDAGNTVVSTAGTCYDNDGNAYSCPTSANVPAVVWSTNTRMQASWAPTPIERRIRTGNVRFQVIATGMVDNYLTIWWRRNDGKWNALVTNVELASDYGTCTAQWVGYISVAGGDYLDFGVTASDGNMRYANSSKPYIKYGNLSVIATNF